MANIFQNSDLTSASAAAPTLTLADGDMLVVARDAEISNTGGNRAVLAEGRANMNILGTLFGLQAVRVNGMPGTTSELVIADTGNLTGTADGVVLETAGFLNITNHGSITGFTQQGVQYFGGQGGTITNFGDIYGQTSGIEIGSGGGPVTLHNFGTITSQGASYQSSPNIVDTVLNAGTMIGDVSLGAGADSYDGAGGRVLGQVLGGAGNDTLLGGDFDDLFSGGTENDRLVGRGGADTLSGEAGNDELYGGDHNDFIAGGAGNDYIDGQGEDDTLYGGDNNDTIFGNAGNDYIDGQGENDVIDGGAGNDTIQGNIGQDQISGGTGFDRLSGGLGDDQFRFYGGDFEPGGRDVISDFAEAGGNADLLVFFDGVTAANVTTFAQGADTLVRVTLNGGTLVHEILVENFTPGQLADQIFFL